MTYCESRGEKPFDWNEFLNRETITEEEWEEAGNLASCWITCACGNQCDLIPRLRGIPTDNDLAWFGKQFSEAVDVKNIMLAKIILQDIEQRSAELIAELTKK